MKVAIEISWLKAAKFLAVLAVGIAIGYVIAVSAMPAVVGQGGEIDFLTSADLNRQDIQASILLSRFCEGLGLRSSVYWQRDLNGNVFGTPICLPAGQ